MKEGDKFPEFELQDQTGSVVKSRDLNGARSIIYFYPKDDTSGCTLESCEFRDAMPRFKGARVIGVSPDNVASHKKFAAKYSLDFILLADPDRKLIEACGLWVEKSMYGKKYMGVERTTFLLGEDGKIAKIWRKVKPEGHAAEVLEQLKS